jgi:hypothetical protein
MPGMLEFNANVQIIIHNISLFRFVSDSDRSNTRKHCCVRRARKNRLVPGQSILFIHSLDIF